MGERNSPRLRLTDGEAYDDALVPRFSRLLAAVAVMSGLLGGCSGADDTATTNKSSKPDKGGGAAPGGFGETVLAADVQAMAAQAPPFPDDVKAAVSASLDAYLDQAVVGPLRTGKPAGAGLDGVFTAAALARLTGPGPDRAAMLEEGAPLAGKVRQERANASLTALTGPGGEVVLVTAQLDLAHTVDTKGGAGSVAVVRSGEVVLVPDGGWRIDAYDLRAARDTQPGGKR